MNTNNLKIVAVIFMIIDHFAYYFHYAISTELYTWCRILGRISMPIFVYLLVQGYFNTKSLKKYKIRLFISAVITQGLILIVKYINLKYYNYYTINVYDILNILFSMFLSLILICLIDRKVLYANNFITSVFDKLIRLAFIIGIVILYLKLNFDYKYFLPLLAISIYIVEKFREFFEWEICNIWYKVILVNVLVILLILSSVILSEINLFAILSILFIVFYNGKLWKKSKFMKYIFYIIFPLQHIILYLSAMILYTKLI